MSIKPSPIPMAWQATADNTVDRQFASAADKTAYEDDAKFRRADAALKALQTHLGTSKTAIDELEQRVRDLCHDLHAPGSELATAQQALIDLKRRNDALIEQCRWWKRRAKDAEAKLEERDAEAKLVDLTRPVKTVSAFSHRPLGDTVRYLAGEVMKHAQDNLELAGIAMALKMVAADVDNLPQG